MQHEDTYDLLSWDRDFFSACWWNLIFFTMLALKSSKPLETRINQLLWSSWWGNLTAGSSFPLQASAFLESESGSLSYELKLIEFVHATRNLTLVNFVCNIQITWTSAFYTKCRAWKSSEETHSEKKGEVVRMLLVLQLHWLHFLPLLPQLSTLIVILNCKQICKLIQRETINNTKLPRKQILTSVEALSSRTSIRLDWDHSNHIMRPSTESANLEKWVSPGSLLGRGLQLCHHMQEVEAEEDPPLKQEEEEADAVPDDSSLLHWETAGVVVHGFSWPINKHTHTHTQFLVWGIQNNLRACLEPKQTNGGSRENIYIQLQTRVKMTNYDMMQYKPPYDHSILWQCRPGWRAGSPSRNSSASQRQTHRPGSGRETQQTLWIWTVSPRNVFQNLHNKDPRLYFSLIHTFTDYYSL